MLETCLQRLLWKKFGRRGLAQPPDCGEDQWWKVLLLEQAKRGVGARPWAFWPPSDRTHSSRSPRLLAETLLFREMSLVIVGGARRTQQWFHLINTLLSP